MTGEIAAILAMDGIASGAIYVLIGLGLVLIFAVTRVIFVPFGDIAAFTALTLASLETGGRPGTVGLVAVLAVLATAVEATALVEEPRVSSAAARAAVLSRPAAGAGRGGLVRGGNDPVDADQDRAVAGARPADRPVARPHRVPADRRRLGPAAAHRGGGAAFRAERARPDVLRPGRRAHQAADRHRVRRRGPHRQRPDAADPGRIDRLLRPAVPLFRVHHPGQGAARHGDQPRRRAPGRHPADLDRHDRLSAGVAARRHLGRADRAGDDDLL